MLPANFFSIDFIRRLEAYGARDCFAKPVWVNPLREIPPCEIPPRAASVLEPVTKNGAYRVLISGTFEDRAEIVERLSGFMGHEAADAGLLYFDGKQYRCCHSPIPSLAQGAA